MSKSSLKRVALAAVVALMAGAPLAALTQANPATNVSAEKLAQATFEPFRVKTAADQPIEMHLKSKVPADLVVRRHTYGPRGSTGWHKHAGPVFILVTKGTLTYYDYDDPDCQGVPIHAGRGFVDDGRGHIVINESDSPAEDMSVIMTTERAQVFRDEIRLQDARCGIS